MLVIAPTIFAAIVVLFTDAVNITIPLFVQISCTRPPCAANTPALPVVPLVAGIVYVAWCLRAAPRVTRALLWGIGLGVLAAMYVGLGRAVAVPFSNDFFGFPYRAYALGYLALATMSAVAVSVASARELTPRGDAARAILAVVVAVLIQLLQAGMLTIGGAVVVGGALGIALERLVPLQVRERLRPNERAMVIVTLVLALAFRAIFGIQTLLRTGPGMAFALGSDDGDAYYGYAVAIASDPSRVADVLAGNAGFPPAYSLFLAGIFALSRESIGAVIITQALLAVAATYLIYRLALPFAGPWVAVIAAALFAVDANIIQNGSTLTAEAILVPLTLLALWSLTRYAATTQFRWLLLSALAFALAFITRNNIFVVVLAAVGWLAVIERKHLGRFLRDGGLLVVACLVAAAPVGIVTAAREGSPRLTNQLAAVTWENEDGAGITIENGFLNRRGISPFRDLGGSVRAFASDPVPVIGFLAVAAPQRVDALLFSVNPGLSDPVTIVNSALIPTTYGHLIEVLLAVSLAVGIAIYVIRRPHREYAAIGLLVAYMVAYFALFAFVFPPRQAFRYRIPVEPIVFIGQAVGLVVMARSLLGMWRRQPVGKVQ